MLKFTYSNLKLISAKVKRKPKKPIETRLRLRLRRAGQKKLQLVSRIQRIVIFSTASKRKKPLFFDRSLKSLYFKFTMIKNTYSNLKLISAKVKHSSKKSLEKPELFLDKTQIGLNSDLLLLNVPHHERSYRQYLEIKSGRESERALYRYRCYDQIKSLTPKGQEVIAYLFMLHMKHRIVNPTQGTIATEVGCHIQTVGRALNDAKEKGILDWETGRWERRANVYKFSSCFYAKIGKKYAMNAIGHFVNMFSESQCRTYIEYNARKHRLTISEMVQHSSETGEGGSPKTVSLPMCAPNNFFNEKDKSCLFAHTLIDNIPTRSATVDKLSAVKKYKNPKREVCSRFMVSKPCKGSILKEKGSVMNNSLKVLADIEEEEMNKNRRMARSGPGRMCPQQYSDLRTSIAYHFGGGYRHNPEDRIFSKEHTLYLRKKYGL